MEEAEKIVKDEKAVMEGDKCEEGGKRIKRRRREVTGCAKSQHCFLPQLLTSSRAQCNPPPQLVLTLKPSGLYPKPLELFILLAIVLNYLCFW
ncbi:hypothetical protein RRG08_014255 [Elysia crispata]|uniref:Uncharacterized protein n=1 Tax=Elysia crispata TaxID=231223 RepID=A0AAE1B663_9GAST|nr:hypothetical protein RRG08_014255 [Elysia crispata]